MANELDATTSAEGVIPARDPVFPALQRHRKLHRIGGRRESGLPERRPGLRQSDRGLQEAVAVRSHSAAISRSNVSTVDRSAIPSARSWRKCNWNAETTVRRPRVIDSGHRQTIAIAGQGLLQPLDLRAAVALPKPCPIIRSAKAAPNGRSPPRAASANRRVRPDRSCGLARHRNGQARAPAGWHCVR